MTEFEPMDVTDHAATIPDDREESWATRPAGPVPRRTTSARLLGPLMAVAVLALGVVGIQHLAVDQGWTASESWLDWVVGSIDGLTPSNGVLVIATLIGVAGLLLVIVAMNPARRSHRFVGGIADGAVPVDLWIDAGAVRDLVSDVAERCPAVASADAASKWRGKVVVEAIAREGQQAVVREQITTGVARRLGDLGPRRLVVKVTEEIA